MVLFSGLYCTSDRLTQGNQGPRFHIKDLTLSLCGEIMILWPLELKVCHRNILTITGGIKGCQINSPASMHPIIMELSQWLPFHFTNHLPSATATHTDCMIAFNSSDAGDGIFLLQVSIPYLLMHLLLKSPGHQQAWYWLYRTDKMYYCSGVNFIYLSQAKSKIWFKIGI